jgi:pentatricopeptide repeat protein
MQNWQPWHRGLCNWIGSRGIGGLQGTVSGQHEKTITIFQEMQKKGMTPNKFTFFPVLNACATLRALEEEAHEQIIQSGCEGDAFVGCSLVDMYAKCGSMEDAQRVFNKMPSRDVLTWNAMILGHGKCAQGQKALELFSQMQRKVLCYFCGGGECMCQLGCT